MALLEIKNLKMDFGKNAAALRAIDGISLSINAGETVSLVGESGCGKTVTALSIGRLVPSPPANYVGGEILLLIGLQRVEAGDTGFHGLGAERFRC